MVKINDIGTHTFNPGFNKPYNQGFKVLEVTPNQKKITVVYDISDEREILTLRSNFEYVPVGKNAEEWGKYNTIRFGRKINGYI